MTIEPAGREEFLALMREAYGSTMSAKEFDWWFDRNPVGPRLLWAARADGRSLGVLGMSFFRMAVGGEETVGAFAIHGVTAPDSRGRGVFSSLEIRNHAAATEAGAAIALGFANPHSGRILVARRGWQDLCRLRVWARPKRVRRRRTARLLVQADRRRFEERHEDAYRREAASWRGHIVRSVDYLNWRYTESPREYVRVERGGGWAVVTPTTWRGWASGIVADAVGPHKAALLRACTEAVDADVMLALPNPGEQVSYLSAGFLPTPRTLHLIGKPLRPEAALPTGRRAWRFSLGDLDFV